MNSIIFILFFSLIILVFYYKKLSEKDLFTNCFTKDWAITRKNSKLVRMMKATNNNGTPFGFLFIDFDNFKKINDSKGHLYGDKVILNIVHLIKFLLHKKDILVRFGGDELMLIVPDVYEESELYSFADNMKWKIEMKVGHTISIGGAIFNRSDVVNVEKFVNRADKNLEAAKEKGKNCVVIA